MNDSFRPSFVCRHAISVLASETTVSQNTSHAVTITVIILSNPLGDRDRMLICSLRPVVGPPACFEEAYTRAHDSLEIASGSLPEKFGDNEGVRVFIGYASRATRQAIRASVPYCPHRAFYDILSGADRDKPSPSPLPLPRLGRRRLPGSEQFPPLKPALSEVL